MVYLNVFRLTVIPLLFSYIGKANAAILHSGNETFKDSSQGLNSTNKTIDSIDERLKTDFEYLFNPETSTKSPQAKELLNLTTTNGVTRNISNYIHLDASRKSSSDVSFSSFEIEISGTSNSNSVVSNTSYLNISKDMELEMTTTPNSKSSKPVVSAVTFSSVYQSVIHLENVSKNDFLNYLNFTRTRDLNISQKNSTDSSKPVKSDSLTQKQLRSIFKLARFGKPYISRCRKPETSIQVKCINNMARITFTSDSESRLIAEASLYKNQSEYVGINAYKVNLYLIWTEKAKAKLRKDPTRKEVTQVCSDCELLQSRIMLEGESHACIIPINCGRPRGEMVIFDESKNSARYMPLITMSLSLHAIESRDGSITVEETYSGKPVNVIIQASSDSIPVGLYVKECRVLASNVQSLILSNGCSISSLLDNFRFIQPLESQTNYYGTTAKFIPFSLKSLPDNLTLNCNIMVCDGICNVHSSCQSALKDHSKAINSRTITMSELELPFRIIEEGVVQQPTSNTTKEISHDLKLCKCEVPEQNLSAKVYLYLALLSCLFLSLLFIVISCMRHKNLVERKKTYQDEIETPPRMFYPDDSNPRRRSPNCSSILNLSR